MAENMRITNLADSGSAERVAYELWTTLRPQLPEQGGPREQLQAQLDFFVQCYRSAHGVKADLEGIV
jgi:hypothetical protein